MRLSTELQSSKTEMVEAEISYSRLDEDLDRSASQKYQKDLDSLIGEVFNLFEVGRKAKSIINPELSYVAKFTPKLLKKMKEHDLKFLEDSVTGDLLPDLYDYTAKGIGGKVRLEIKGKPTGQDLANLSHSINNLIEQKRYDTLIEEVHKLHVVAKRIERGQDNDRFSKVNAGRKHLMDALNYQGSEEERTKMIMDALVILREGRELIEKTLLDKIEALDWVPENIIQRLWKCFVIPDYFHDNVDRYDDIQEYFQYYYMSIQPMAYAYTVLGQPQLINTLLEDSKKVFEHRKIGYLASIELLLPNREFDNMWYSNPMAHEQKLIEAYRGLDEDEDLYIIIKGSQLLEAMDDDERTKEV